MDDNCIFCKIIAGVIPSYKIYEDAEFLAFLDISQFTPGHTLVVPKKHVRFIWDIDNSAAYFALIQKIADHYRQLGYKYIDTLSFGRQVPHAHFHLVPHNDDNQEWQAALRPLDDFTNSIKPRISPEIGNALVARLHLN